MPKSIPRVGGPTVTFRIELHVERDGTSFHAYSPALKGLHVAGDSEEEAIRNAVDAAKAYLESSIKHGDPIPTGVVVREGYQKTQHTHHTRDLAVACA